MIKTNGWVNALFALVFIASPAMLGYYIYLPDWGAAQESTWFYWVVSLGFLGYVALLSLVLIKFEFLGIKSLNFNVPISLVFVLIFVSYDWHVAVRVLAVIAAVFFAFPVNMATNYYVDLKIAEMKKR